eukprot:CAMPEP_0197854136 /NCGR_PEP_ID=MMETSP1438-20131217/24097_1 /TAXON_ID=1461541 /ORGANISM="Pterosperma sp., Strain CCMP1384" /LENGTH=146 /DNA_ID=CAMNT_0043468783 /DNA_START=1 /DNA_END=438 /DNA_ORIENTATION=+
MFGLVINTSQMLFLELGELRGLHWGADVALLLLGFVAALFTFYALVPKLLRDMGSAAFNLSMLTSDLWAAASRALWFGGFQNTSTAWAFVAALVLVTIGLIIFYLEHLKAVDAEGTTKSTDGGPGGADLAVPDQLEGGRGGYAMLE